MQQTRPAFPRVAGLHENLVNDAGSGRGDLVLHLHRFEHEQAGAAADFRAFFDEHARDAARHERFDDAAVAEVIVAAFAAEGERIDDLDVYTRRTDRDLVHRPFAVMREQKLRSVLHPQRAQSAGGDQVRDDPAFADFDAIRAAVTLDFERNLFVAIAGGEDQSRPRIASMRAACRQRETLSSGSRTFCASSNAMIAAATSAASRVASSPGRCSRSSCGRIRSINPVSKFAVRKSGWFMRNVKNGIVVLMPSTRYSCSARSIRSIASPREPPCAISFESIGSQ